MRFIIFKAPKEFYMSKTILSPNQVKRSIASIIAQAKPGYKRASIIAYIIVNAHQINSQSIASLEPQDLTVASQVRKALSLGLEPDVKTYKGASDV